MRAVGLASMFVAIVGVAAVVLATLATVLLRFAVDAGPWSAWRSLVVALAAAGAALGAVALLHLALIAARQSIAWRHAQRILHWTVVWSDVAAGGRLPPLPVRAHDAIVDAAAQVLEQVQGEGAERVRALLADTGLLARDLDVASRALGTPRGRSAAALERLARIAAPSALPLFRRAATSHDVRTARGALLGAARVLAAQERPEPLGNELVGAIADHVAVQPGSAATRPFLTASLIAAGNHLPWLAGTLLAGDGEEAAQVAALEALGLSRRPEAMEIAADVLRRDAEDEVRAAALRTLARLGHVPERAIADVIAASTDAHVGTRVQAAYALVGLPLDVALPTLWPMLGDRVWDVRRAAATAMLRCGDQGVTALRHAAGSHFDGFARDVAHYASTHGLVGATAPALAPVPVAAASSGPT